MDQTTAITVIVPCFFVNAHFVEMTNQCLESMDFEWPDELIVVNDGSPYNRELDYIKRMADKYISYPDNRGFARAVNCGLEHASGDFLVLANNDIIFCENWLTELLRPLHKGFDIASVRTSDADGYETADKITEGDNFGSLWAMKRAVYRKLGGLPTDYGKGYFEDQAYKQLALDAGFRIAKNHRVVVEHIGGATFNEVDPNKTNFQRNRQKYLKKFGRID